MVLIFCNILLSAFLRLRAKNNIFLNSCRPHSLCFRFTLVFVCTWCRALNANQWKSSWTGTNAFLQEATVPYWAGDRFPYTLICFHLPRRTTVWISPNMQAPVNTLKALECWHGSACQMLERRLFSIHSSEGICFQCFCFQKLKNQYSHPLHGVIGHVCWKCWKWAGF